VGRIMRVHRAVRPIHTKDALLDSGYVLLTDPDMQSGLQAAVDELKAVKESIELITDSLDVYEFGNADKPTGLSDIEARPNGTPQPPVDDAERQQRLTNLIEQGIVWAHVKNMAPEEQDRAIVTGETWQQMAQTPLFGNLPEAPRSGTPAPPTRPNFRPYPIR